jgi:hypothetical protein
MENQEQEANEIPAQIAQRGNTDIARANNGYWLPGMSGNPSGRPKIKRISDAYAQILDERGAEQLAETVYRDAIGASKAADRLAAVQEITDRVEGKAVQSVRVESAIDAGSARLLAELASALQLSADHQDGTNRPLLETAQIDMDTPLESTELTPDSTG